MTDHTVTVEDLCDSYQFPRRSIHGSVNCSGLIAAYLQGTGPLLSMKVDGAPLMPNSAYGIAIANLNYAGRYYGAVGDPRELIGCLIGDPFLGYNGLRMMPALIRLCRQSSEDVLTGEFRDVVGSAVPRKGAPSDLRWGDFTDVGCSIAGSGSSQAIVAVDGLDDWNMVLSSTLAHLIASRLERTLTR